MAQLAGKVALVTGGGSGIGQATALMFAREGAKVVVADTNSEGGQETVDKIKKAGGESMFVRTDVSKAADTEIMVNKTIEAYGQLNCAFNNAGIEGGEGSIVEYSEDVWDRVFDINLKGVWLCMKYEIPEMLKQGRGAIVNTASIMGLIGGAGNPAYVASKHGVVGLTKVGALRYAKEGIRVNAVCPGVISTPMVERVFARNPGAEAWFLEREPMGRFGAPEEIAETVIWLCSEAASFITGHTMTVDGGYVAQ